MPRELEIDVAFELGRLSFGSEVFALDPYLHPERRENPDALLFAVLLRPYSIENVVKAHYLLLAVAQHVVSGRVLYVDPEVGLPLPVRGGRALSLTSTERVGAAERASKRAVRMELERGRRAEEVARSAADLRRLFDRGGGGTVAAPFDSGVFEVVADPFPSLLRRPARVLVLDEDPRTSATVRALGSEVAVVERPESSDWGAIERAIRADFDLVLCALRFGRWTGAQIHRLLAAEQPTMTRRLVFITDVAPQSAPESARGRVLTRPIDPEEIRRLLYARRAGTPVT